MAMSTSDMHMVAHSKSEPLSAEALVHYAVKHQPGGVLGSGLTIGATAQALQSDGQPLEVDFPYGVPIAPADLPGTHQHWFGELVPHSTTALSEISVHIGNGDPVLLIIRLTEEFFCPKVPWIISDPGLGFALHAVVGAGTGVDQDGGPLFLIRNSWGPQWGDGGYVWLHGAYLSLNLVQWSLIKKL